MPGKKKKKTKDKDKDKDKQQDKDKDKKAKLVNAKTLSKKNPDACAKLRAGSLTPDELAEQVAELALQNSTLPRSLPQFPTKDNPNVTADIHSTQDLFLLKSLFPNQLDEDTYQFCDEFKRLEHKNMFKFQSELSNAEKHDMDLLEYGMKGFEAKQKAFEHTAEKWIQANKLPYCTPRRMKKNPFYKVSIMDFAQALFHDVKSNLDLEGEGAAQMDDLIKNGEETRKVYNETKRAATGIVAREDKIRNTCWQCDTSAAEGVIFASCARCSTAVYCSKLCQTTAWKEGGHKQVCATLQTKYNQYKLDRARIDHAISSQRIVEGLIVSSQSQEVGDGVSVTGTGGSPKNHRECYLKPVAVYDYTLASMNGLITHKEFEGVIGPTMELFYHNLATIACGGTYPLFCDDRNGHLHTTEEFLESKTFDLEELKHRSLWDEVTSVEMRTLQIMNSFLGYDFTNATDEVIQEFRTHAREEIAGGGRGGKLLTVAQVIRYYGIQSNNPDIASYGPQHRYEAHIKFNKDLKRMYSKKEVGKPYDDDDESAADNAHS